MTAEACKDAMSSPDNASRRIGHLEAEAGFDRMADECTAGLQRGRSLASEDFSTLFGQCSEVGPFTEHLSASCTSFPDVPTMAMLDSRLLEDLDAIATFWGDQPEAFEDVVVDGGRWCTAADVVECRHAIGEVRDGYLRLDRLPGSGGARLAGLLERIAGALVAGRPIPIECRDLPDADRIVAAAELAWRPLEESARRDPDLAVWTRILSDRLKDVFANWCFGLLCALSGGTTHRLDEADGGERWIAAEPELLGAALDACLRGDRDGWFIAGDPLRRAARSSLARDLVA